MKVIETDSPDILAFEREREDDRILVLVNLSGVTQPVNFKEKEPGMAGMQNYLFRLNEKIPVEMQPWEFQVYTTLPKLKRDHYAQRYGTEWNPINITRYLSSLTYRDMVDRDRKLAKRAAKINEGKIGWDELETLDLVDELDR